MVEGLGARLREERERQGLGVEEFGAGAGVATSTQRNYEKGTRSPDADYLVAIDAKGVDIGYVLTGKRTSTRSEAEALEDQCRILDAVISGVDEAVERHGIAIDGAKRRECIVFLYRAAHRGLELDPEIVRDLLCFAMAGCAIAL